MNYFNTGALYQGTRIRSKKELRQLLRQHPSWVYFDSTSPLQEGNGYFGDEVPAGLVLSVCGPDPYVRRQWWATVRRDSAGRLRVT